MFIDTLLKRISSLQGSEMCFSTAKMFRSYGAGKLGGVVVTYKHLVPLGPKTTATKHTDCFVT